jgi:hypothetical protein
MVGRSAHSEVCNSIPEQCALLIVPPGALTFSEETDEKALHHSRPRYFATASAHAQTKVPTNFYVVRDSTTKTCSVVDTKPVSSAVTVVENGEFPTKEQAETAIKTIKLCN